MSQNCPWNLIKNGESTDSIAQNPYVLIPTKLTPNDNELKFFKNKLIIIIAAINQLKNNASIK